MKTTVGEGRAEVKRVRGSKAVPRLVTKVKLRLNESALDIREPNMLLCRILELKFENDWAIDALRLVFQSF